MNRSRHLLAVGALVCFVAGLLPMSTAASFDASGAAEELAQGKKGRESCESDAECETKVCQNGACHPCPDRENCPPPGICDEDTHQTLQGEKDKACDKKRACPDVKPGNVQDADCRRYTAFRTNGKECVDARRAVMDKCFEGGNSKHVGLLAEAQEVLDGCSAYIEHKMDLNLCYECDNFDSLRKQADEACGAPTQCVEKKDGAKADCSSMRKKIQAADLCTKRQDELAVACFNSGYSAKRGEARRAASGNATHCRDVLDFKEGKMLCQ